MQQDGEERDSWLKSFSESGEKAQIDVWMNGITKLVVMHRYVPFIYVEQSKKDII